MSTGVWKREPSEEDDLPAMVAYHGANDWIDALLGYAVEAYGDEAKAVEKVHEFVLIRAAKRLAEPTEPTTRREVAASTKESTT